MTIQVAQEAPYRPWVDVRQDVRVALDGYLATTDPDALAVARERLAAAVPAVAAFKGWDLIRDERVSAADSMRQSAVLKDDVWLAELADMIAGPPVCLRAIKAFDEQLKAYNPEAAAGVRVPAESVRAAMRAAIASLLASKPRAPLELGDKAKRVAIVGAFAKVKDACAVPDPYAANLWRHWRDEIEPVAAWFFAHSLRCHSTIGENEFGERGGSFIASSGGIRDMIAAAGRAAVESLAADVERLNRDEASC